MFSRKFEIFDLLYMGEELLKRATNLEPAIIEWYNMFSAIDHCNDWLIDSNVWSIDDTIFYLIDYV